MKRPGIIGPLILIAAGFILLFNNLGLLSWSIWAVLWNFWPVLLILIGLDIIVSHTDSRVSYVLGVLLGIAIIIGVIYLAWIDIVPFSQASPGNLIEGEVEDMKDKDIRGKFLIGRDLNGADLEGKDLRDAILIGANMNHADLHNASLGDALLIGTNLNSADLHGADLTDALLIGANLNGANLTDTDMTDANLIGANLIGANLCGAELRNANTWTVETTDTTICPDCSNGPCW